MNDNTLEKTKKKNPTISICKGIAIILMVIGHAEAPGLITNFIYLFHMPLFFIAAGYFFSRKYLDTPWQFISKRIKSLYFPFLKWSFIFLILHNVWFYFGILNEEYGNLSGGVTHPYSFSDAIHRIILMITGMSGYDEFIAGAFWFFRGLLVASIMFLLLYKLLDSKMKWTPTISFLIICGGMILFTWMHIHFGFKIKFIPNGGWRETWGIFFFSVGALFRTYESKYKINFWITLLFFALLCVGAVMHLSGMNNGGKYQDLISLPITGLIGFLMIYNISTYIAGKKGKLRDWLTFIGDNTLYIFILHTISYKPVSLLKVYWYGLDPKQIGCHMVIHDHHEDYFWILYSISGVCLPLLALWIWKKFPSIFSSLKLRINKTKTE